jgi:hypothetical protein
VYTHTRALLAMQPFQRPHAGRFWLAPSNY